MPGHPAGGLVARAEQSAAARDAALDREHARRRGVVHTPAPIARFVAREADRALREELARPRGIAERDVVVVDPATGPGIFLAAAIELAGTRGAPRACVGLEVDPGAAELASSVLDPAARALGWPLRVACCDALASLAPVPELEDDDVARVVIGNPPWAARSANRDAALTEVLLDDFRRDASGARLGERKLGVLSDDYVRFIRWSVELVRRAQRGGVVALVTNASFLDGPVHRAMRAALARWLDRVDVVELGGSGLVARARAADENVFGVRPSVAITIGVRHPRAEPRRAALRVATLGGTRAEKLDALEREPLPWRERAPDEPWRAPSARRAPLRYRSWPSLAEWMPFHREGLQTNRDDLVIARDRGTLVTTLDAFARGGPARERAHWDADRARRVARALLDDPGALDRALRPLAYRPFDARWVIADPALCHRPRPELARACDASPFTLITARKDRGQRAWTHFGATAALPDNCWLSTRSSCRARAFPIVDAGGAPNLDPRLARATEDALGAALEPTTFAHWALAWMAAEPYRAACDDALRADYPRIPAPRSAGELAAIAAAGAAIVRAMVETPSPIALRVHRARAGRIEAREDDGVIARGGAAWIEGAPPAALRLVLGHGTCGLRWLDAHGDADPDALARALAAMAATADAIADASAIVALHAPDLAG